MTAVQLVVFFVAVLAAIPVAIQTATRSRPSEELLLAGALAAASAAWIGAPLAGWSVVLAHAGALGVLFGAASSCAADDAATPDASVTPAHCLGVTGAGPEPWLSLQVVGSKLQAHEDLRIRVTVASGGRVAVAQDDIVDGGFELALPGAINYGYYPEIALYVDTNVDDSCDSGEALWGVVTGIVQDDVLLELTPDQVCVRSGGPQIGVGCRAWPPPTDVCVINGATDLAAPVSCSP